MTLREFIKELEAYGNKWSFDDEVVFRGHDYPVSLTEMDSINYIERTFDNIKEDRRCEISLM